MTPKILLSFDVEEFDMPLEYNFNIAIETQMEIGKKGLDNLMPILNDQNYTLLHYLCRYTLDIKYAIILIVITITIAVVGVFNFNIIINCIVFNIILYCYYYIINIIITDDRYQYYYCYYYMQL